MFFEQIKEKEEVVIEMRFVYMVPLTAICQQNIYDSAHMHIIKYLLCGQ